jgi:hypothetical protein
LRKSAYRIAGIHNAGSGNFFYNFPLTLNLLER